MHLNELIERSRVDWFKQLIYIFDLIKDLNKCINKNHWFKSSSNSMKYATPNNVVAKIAFFHDYSYVFMNILMIKKNILSLENTYILLKYIAYILHTYMKPK